MRILNGLRRAFRGFFGLRASASSDLKHWSWSQGSYYGRRTTAGTWISPESAMGLAAYYACVRNIGEDIAKLPLRIQRQTEGRGHEILKKGNPVHRLLNRQPNPWMTAYTFRETLTQWAAGWGNGYAEIVWDNRGAAAQLWPIHPSRVTVSVSGGALQYEVRADDRRMADAARIVVLPPGRMLHVRGLGNDVCGYSVATVGRESLGLTAGAQEFGASFFGNDATLGNYVIPPDSAGETQRIQLQKNLDAVKDASFKHLVLPPGVKIERGMVPPEDIQFLETRQFQLEEVCRWFRMPPHKAQHLLRATFANIEEQNIEYVVDTLTPWAKRWEQEIEAKLLVAPDLEARHVFNALLRGDYQKRTAGYAIMRQNGIYSSNDVRELEDENPIEGKGGDDYHIQQNMQKLGDVGKVPVPPAPRLPSAPEPKEPVEPKEPEDDAARIRPVVRDAASRCERRRLKALMSQADTGRTESEFVQWCNRFLSGHRAYMASAFAAVWEYLGSPDGLREILDSAQASYLRHSIEAYRAGALAQAEGTEAEWVEDLTNTIMAIGERNGHQRVRA